MTTGTYIPESQAGFKRAGEQAKAGCLGLEASSPAQLRPQLRPGSQLGGGGGGWGRWGGYRGPAAVGGQLSLCSAGDGVLVVDTLGWRFPKGSDNWQHLPKAIGHLSTPAVQCPLLGRNRVWCVDSFVLFSKERLESCRCRKILPIFSPFRL